MESEPSGDPRRSSAFTLWRAFARADEDACKNALGVLEDILGEGVVPRYGVGVTSFGFIVG
jgi:hypothetical protein